MTTESASKKYRLLIIETDDLICELITRWATEAGHVVVADDARAIATSAALARTGWFDTGLLAGLAEAHRTGRADHSRLLWQLLMLDRSLTRLGLVS